MYESHFGLKQRPFHSAPDCSRYYPATGHEHALEQLLQALADDEGLVLLTGEPGVGKTLLCHCLLQRSGDVRSAFLLEHCPEKGSTLLVVDEAHHLSPDLLEELRLLSNLEGGAGRALQVVLVALPAILETLARPELASFRQRLVARACLTPLAPAEAADYLLHHLRAVTDRPEHLLTEETLEVLARGTGGVPRRLNQAGHRALALAHSAGAVTVDVEAALEALAVLGLENVAEPREECAAVVSGRETADCPVRMSLLDGETPGSPVEGIEPEEIGETSRLRRPVVGPRTA
ncbi:MAG: AAA family ATPase [Planctomycetes bacterium]|nr:AAA family ATPase [Planctomycetota bacterium]